VKTLPPDVFPYQRTREFTESTVPDALRRRHTTKRGAWARIQVLEGSLRSVEAIMIESNWFPEAPFRFVSIIFR
jgi:tellurite resistance-related uncharacterized protein